MVCDDGALAWRCVRAVTAGRPNAQDRAFDGIPARQEGADRDATTAWPKCAAGAQAAAVQVQRVRGVWELAVERPLPLSAVLRSACASHDACMRRRSMTPLTISYRSDRTGRELVSAKPEAPGKVLRRARETLRLGATVSYFDDPTARTCARASPCTPSPLHAVAVAGTHHAHARMCRGLPWMLLLPLLLCRAVPSARLAAAFRRRSRPTCERGRGGVDACARRVCAAGSGPARVAVPQHRLGNDASHSRSPPGGVAAQPRLQHAHLPRHGLRQLQSALHRGLWTK